MLAVAAGVPGLRGPRAGGGTFGDGKGAPRGGCCAGRVSLVGRRRGSLAVGVHDRVGGRQGSRERVLRSAPRPSVKGALGVDRAFFLWGRSPRTRCHLTLSSW